MNVRTLIDRGYYTRENEDQFRADAIAEVGLDDEPEKVQKLAYEMAYERGHASGYGEIMNELEEAALFYKRTVVALLRENRAAWSTTANDLGLLVGRYRTASESGAWPEDRPGAHLPAVTDGTVATLAELHRAMGSLSWRLDEWGQM